MATIAYRPDGTMVTGSAARRAIDSGQATAPSSVKTPRTNEQSAAIAAKNTAAGFGTTTQDGNTATYTSKANPLKNTFSYQTDTTVQDQDGTEQDDTTISEMYKGYLPTQDANYTDAQKAYRESLNYQEPMSDEDIMAKTRARMQSEIDALNKVYTEKLRQEAIAGRGRLGQSRAIQAASGQLGSTFGQAQKNVVSMENQNLENAIRDQQLADQIKILTEGRKDTVAEAEKQVQAKRDSAKNILEYYAGQVTEKANRLKATVANMIDSGETIDEATFTELAKALGVSPLEVKALYNATKVEKQTKDNETLSPGEALVGPDGKLIYQNPATEKAATGIVAEYEYYVAQQKEKGLPYDSFDEYQTKDANRKARAAAVVDASGLTPTQQSQFLRITDNYQKDALVQAFDKGKGLSAIADQVLADPNNATNQLKALYGLVKNLDPDSAVREGEIALANKTTSYLERFKTSLESVYNGQVISPEAAKKLATATKELVAAWGTGVEGRKQRYTAQAQTVGIGDAFNSYLGLSNDDFGTPTQPETNILYATGDDSLTEYYNNLIDSNYTPEEALKITQEDNAVSWQPSFNTPVSAGSTNSGTADKPLVIAKSPVDPNTKHDAECVVYSRMFAPNLPRIAWSETSKAKNAEYKRKVINTTTPQVGAVAIMPTVGFYGHTANVIGKNPDGTITIQEANYKDGKVTRRTGTPEELKIEGYFYDGVTKPIA